MGSKLSVVDTSLSFVFLEVFNVHAGQLGGLRIIRARFRPRTLNVQDFLWDTVQGNGNVKSKDGMLLEFGMLNGSIQNGINASTGRLDGHSVSLAVGATGPAGIDEVGVRSVLVQLLLQQIRVDGGMHGHKGSPKASTECRDGFRDTTLGSSDLGGVSGQEMVHGLSRTEPGDRWKDTKGIAGEENDIFGVARHLFLVLLDKKMG
jgi:hypothetical protein